MIYYYDLEALYLAVKNAIKRGITNSLQTGKYDPKMFSLWV